MWPDLDLNPLQALVNKSRTIDNERVPKKHPTLYRGSARGDVKRQDIFNFWVACGILCKVAQLIVTGIVGL